MSLRRARTFLSGCLENYRLVKVSLVILLRNRMASFIPLMQCVFVPVSYAQPSIPTLVSTMVLHRFV